jgi:predicted GNAT family N-acyltransferase
MKIIHKNCSNENISIMLEDSSICSLDLMNCERARMADIYKLKITGDLYWFCRLKAKKEGQGSGTILMKELVKILDEKQAWVMNVINPYGKMTMEQLELFYAKYGFIKIGEGFMYRPPNPKS